tara:strand:+ start:177 stop:857 length:681 start_codon:yes stop_codon:yes gene_type:complete
MLVLDTLSQIGEALGEFIRDVVPVLVRILEKSNVEMKIRRKCLIVLMHITKSSFMELFASRIIHLLVRLLSRSDDSTLQVTAMKCLCCMVCRLGAKFIPHVLPVRTALHQKLHQANRSDDMDYEYHSLVMKAIKGETVFKEPTFEDDDDDKSIWKMNMGRKRTTLGFNKKMSHGASGSIHIGMLHGIKSKQLIKVRSIAQSGLNDLKSAWDVSGRTTAGDWIEWMR